MIHVYTAVNFDGRASDGEAAVAVVLRNEQEKPGIKVYGFSHVSYQYAEGLGVAHAVRLIPEGEEVTFHVTTPYVANMLNGWNAKVHKEMWTYIRERMKKARRVYILWEKEHIYKASAIRYTQKGGYHMQNMAPKNTAEYLSYRICSDFGSEK